MSNPKNQEDFVTRALAQKEKKEQGILDKVMSLEKAKEATASSALKKLEHEKFMEEQKRKRKEEKKKAEERKIMEAAHRKQVAAKMKKGQFDTKISKKNIDLEVMRERIGTVELSMVDYNTDVRKILKNLKKLKEDYPTKQKYIMGPTYGWVEKRITELAPTPAIGGGITGGTAGSVLFVNPDGIIAQDNANFYWDDTNDYLGIGVGVPDSQFHSGGTYSGLTDEYVVHVEYTANKPTSGDMVGLFIEATETSMADTHDLLRFDVDGSTKLRYWEGGQRFEVTSGYLAVGNTSAGLQTTAGDMTLHIQNVTYDNADIAVEMLGGDARVRNTSGQYVGLSVNPHYNQTSGTGANTDFLVNRSETAVGSGTQIVTDFQVANTSLWNLQTDTTLTHIASHTKSTGDEFAHKIDLTTNKATSGRSDALIIDITDTLSPVDPRGIQFVYNSTEYAYISRLGNFEFQYGAIRGHSGYLFLDNNPAGLPMWFNFSSDHNAGDVYWFKSSLNRSLTDTDGHQNFMYWAFDVDQSGTAGYSALDIDITETSTGSGTNRWIDISLGGTTKVYMDNAGQLVLDADTTYGNTTGIAFGDGDTGIFENADDELDFVSGGATTSAAAKFNFTTATDSSGTDFQIQGSKNTGTSTASAVKMHIYNISADPTVNDNAAGAGFRFMTGATDVDANRVSFVMNAWRYYIGGALTRYVEMGSETSASVRFMQAGTAKMELTTGDDIIITDNLKVGGSLGDTPSEVLEVVGDASVSTNAWFGSGGPHSGDIEMFYAYNNPASQFGNLFICSSDAFAIDKGGTLSLGGKYDGSNYTLFGTIIGGKENVTSGNADGYLAFYTQGPSIAEHMRINSDGRVSIGTTASKGDFNVEWAYNNPASQFGNVYVYTDNAQAADTGGTVSLGGKYHDDGSDTIFATLLGGKDNGTSNNANGYFSVYTQGTGGIVERLKVTSDNVTEINNQALIDKGGNFGSSTGVVFGDGDSGLWEAADDQMVLKCANVSVGTYGLATPNDTTIYMTDTFTNASNFAQGLFARSQHARTDASTGNTARGVTCEVWLDATNTQNWTNAQALVGGYFKVETRTFSAGTVAGMVGGYFDRSMSGSGATVTKSYGIQVADVSTSGPATNAGIYIDTQNSGSSRNFSIWNEGGPIGTHGDIWITDDFNILNGSAANANIVLGETGAAVFNEQGADVDFRIEGAGQANAFVVEGVSGQVVLGAAAPPDDKSFEPTLSMVNEDGVGMFEMYNYRSSTGHNQVNCFAARGTVASPSAVTAGVEAGSFAYFGYEGATDGFQELGSFSCYVKNVQGDGDLNGAWKFETGVNGGTMATNLVFHYGATYIPVDTVVWGSETSAADGDIIFQANGQATFNEQGNDVDFRIEGDTEPNLFYVDAGDEAIRMGDYDTNYVEVANTGDVTFVGGAGLQFAEIYYAGSGFDVTLAAQDTDYQVTGFDTNGQSNGATPDHTNDHITISKAGMYLISYSTSSRSTQSNDFEFEVKTDNGATDIANSHTHRTTSVAGALGVASTTCIADLAASATVELWVKRTDGGAVSKTLTIEHVNLVVTQIGGT